MLLDDLLSEGANASGDKVTLPPHHRCAAHIINLLATKDARKAFDQDASYRKKFESTEEKLKTWWRRQGRSDLVAATIKEGLGVKLEVPTDVRWNSEFDGKSQVP